MDLSLDSSSGFKQLRLILTFTNLSQVLKAEKALRTSGEKTLACRATPTPPGLSQAICGMSLELLDPFAAEAATSFLTDKNLTPEGIHQVSR
jgi:hypothetical protein